MFFVREIPVVIEPGVAVLEAEMTVGDANTGERKVAAIWRDHREAKTREDAVSSEPVATLAVPFRQG